MKYNAAEISIDEVANTNCDEVDVEFLAELFEALVRKYERSHVRRLDFDLADFTTAKERGMTDYTLCIEKYTEANANQWRGAFEGKNSRLVLLATIES